MCQGKSLKIGKVSPMEQTNTERQKSPNQAEMAESEGIQAIVNKVVVQMVIAVIVVLRDAPTQLALQHA